jgi:predicted O-methyltransferase YrrM
LSEIIEKLMLFFHRPGSGILFIFRYVLYLFRSGHRRGHGIHSPFVYNFYQHVLGKKISKTDKVFIKRIIRNYRQDDSVIDCPEMGAGSVYSKDTKVQVRQFVNRSSVSLKYGKILYKLAEYFQPSVVLELGTGWGISTVYLRMGCKTSKIYTIEACAEKVNYAKSQFSRHQFANIQTLQDSFENGIFDVSRKEDKFDLVFIDGDHTYENTIHYFNALYDEFHNNTVLVFDDIYWSRGMMKAWKYIRSSEKVSLTIDLFQFGIVFFKKELSKQNFRIKY